jgi:hypothetical protein
MTTFIQNIRLSKRLDICETIGYTKLTIRVIQKEDNMTKKDDDIRNLAAGVLPENDFASIFGTRCLKGETLDLSENNAPSKAQPLLFKVGDKVVSTGKGQIKPGVILTIKETDVVNNWARYFAGGVWLRQQDIKAI